MADLSGLSVVEVIWHDAHQLSEWMDIKDLDQDPYVVRSLGWLLPDAKPGHVVIAQSAGSDDQVDGVLCVPAGMVVKMRVVLPTHFG
jgi:hypothetical protein